MPGPACADRFGQVQGGEIQPQRIQSVRLDVVFSYVRNSASTLVCTHARTDPNANGANFACFLDQRGMCLRANKRFAEAVKVYDESTMRHRPARCRESVRGISTLLS